MAEQAKWDIALGNETLEVHNLDRDDSMFSLISNASNMEGEFPSEARMRYLAIQNRGMPEMTESYWDVSTMIATRKNPESNEIELKIILPCCGTIDGWMLPEIGKRTLSLIAKVKDAGARRRDGDSDPRGNLGSGFKLKNDYWAPNSYSHTGISWDNLSGEGVYSRQLEDWFEKDKEGKLIGLNENMTIEQAKRCPLRLTLLQHPEYVGEMFALPEDVVTYIIDKTFEFGKKEHGLDLMMGQYVRDNFSGPPFDHGTLNLLRVGALASGAESKGDYGKGGWFDDFRHTCIPFRRKGQPRLTPIERVQKRFRELVEKR
ncbi:hypothetical protein HN832_04360 [archaeon]|jgi:hypothetical protein|nr:hypothetical protein [archaeon]MBT4373373.1 hypothetical protein [archaeon]MBT4531821.1 hypothetical protein [archaeon]MBT7001488.1 hypothetical protein [archaeon]MBT7282620.1 hypothetical protein [archaeon]